MKTRRRNYSDDDDHRLTIITHRNKQSKKSTNRTENSGETIPIDLIYEILSRLPAKSVAKCRCVSKLWSSILRRQDFSEIFLTRSRTRPQILFACENQGELLFLWFPQPQNPDLKNSSPIVVSSDQIMGFPFNDSEIIGPVHGLICLLGLQYTKFGNETLPVICNPNTGQTLVLPVVKTKRMVEVRSFLMYEPVDKHFKVLLMSVSKGVVVKYQILTIGGTAKKLSWRKMKSSVLLQPHYSYDKGICINDVLYYRASSNNFSRRSSMIVCFDVRSEKFRFIKLAEDLRLGRLVNYKDKLGSIVSNHGSDVDGSDDGNGRSIELWVLEDHTEEWSKKHTYVLPAMWRETLGYDYLCFVGMTRTNEIVFSPLKHDCDSFDAMPSCLVYYNVERNTIVKVEIQGMEAFEGKFVYKFLDQVEDLNSCKCFNLDLYNLRSL